MGNPASGESKSTRIAVLWQPAPFQAQRILSAIYHRAALEPDVTLRKFDPTRADWKRRVRRDLFDWQPHGLILRLSDPKLVADIRKQYPGIPMVATLVTPPGLVDTSVSMDAAEAIAACRDHFRSRGISTIAYFYGSVPALAHCRSEPFRGAVPDGHFMGVEFLESTGIRGLPSSDQEKITAWIHGLPKPVGIMSMEGLCARHLLGYCQEIGYRVPQEIQIIGIDDVDHCLACEPHLTSVDPNSEGIGETAMESLLHHLRRDEPRQPPTIRVAGCKLIARGSTGLTAIGSGKIASAIRAIETSASRGLSAARIVKQSRVSHTTFYKHFRATTGNTPARQLRETRLRKACKMLAETEATMTEIADACGFSGGNYFARFFRHTIGQTPTEYRRRFR